MLRRAVERELSIVGEAVSQAMRYFPKLEESIGPARRIVVQNEVPRLLEKSEALLEESGHGG